MAEVKKELERVREQVKRLLAKSKAKLIDPTKIIDFTDRTVYCTGTSATSVQALSFYCGTRSGSWWPAEADRTSSTATRLFAPEPCQHHETPSVVGGVRAGVETVEAGVAAEAGGVRATLVASLGEVDGGGPPLTSLTRALRLVRQNSLMV